MLGAWKGLEGGGVVGEQVGAAYLSTTPLRVAQSNHSLLTLQTLPQISLSDGMMGIGFETRVGTYEVILLNTKLYPT